MVLETNLLITSPVLKSVPYIVSELFVEAFHATLYILFQNGHHLSILLFDRNLALLASFKVKYSFEF